MSNDSLEQGWKRVTLSISSNVHTNTWKLTLHFDGLTKGHEHDPDNEVTALAPDGTEQSWPQALIWHEDQRQATEVIERFGGKLEEVIKAKTSGIHTNIQEQFTNLIKGAAEQVILFQLDLYTASTWTSNAIHSYPWEIMYWGGSAILRYYPVIHRVKCESPLPEPSLHASSIHRALIVITDGYMEEDPEFTAHKKLISSQFKEQGFSIDCPPSATAEVVKNILRNNHYDVLYIACHGRIDADAGVLELANGTFLTGQELKSALADSHQLAPLSMVVICACESAKPLGKNSTFAMAPFLVYSGLTRQAMGFLARVGISFGLDFGLELMKQKTYASSWASAYFRARRKLNKDDSYWPLARFFINYHQLNLIDQEYLDPPRPLPSLPGADTGHANLKLEEAGLRDWLRRYEDPDLVFVTGCMVTGKTLVLRSIKPPPRSAILRTRSQSILWIDELEWTTKVTDKVAITRGILQLMMTIDPTIDTEIELSDNRAAAGEQIDPGGQSSVSFFSGAAVESLQNRFGVLILENWPSNVAFPDLPLGPRWKTVVIASQLPSVGKDQCFLELNLLDKGH